MGWDSVARNATLNILGLDSRSDLNFAGFIDSVSAATDDTGPLIPIIVRIDEDNKSAEASKIVGQLVEVGVIKVSSWYLTQGDGSYPGAGRTYVAYATVNFFRYLAGETPKDGSIPDLKPLIDALKQIEIRSPIFPQQDARDVKENRSTRLNAVSRERLKTSADDTVIMAIIDDGIAIANTRFQNNSGSRIEYFWPQKITDTDVNLETVDDLQKTEIDDLLNKPYADGGALVGGVVDEDLFYHQASLTSAHDYQQDNQLTRRTTHGTHVLDMAAGYAKEADVQNRPIIAVQLPSQIVRDTSGRDPAVDRDVHVLQALKYIVGRANQLSEAAGKHLPLVINFSFGTYSGPHDGTSLLELAIDDIIHDDGTDENIDFRAKTRIVLPAGNSRQTRTHSHIDKSTFTPDPTQTKQPVELNWRVQPDDLTDSHLHIWLSPLGGSEPPQSDRITLSVLAPDGSASPSIGDSPSASRLEYRVNDNDEAPVCIVESSFVQGETNRSLFTLQLSPTAYNTNWNVNDGAPPKRSAPAGVWKVVITDVGMAEDTNIECWIERDDTALGYRLRGRQSYFDDPSYERFLKNSRPSLHDLPEAISTTRRNGTLNSIATGRHAIVVGAMYEKEQTVTDYSSSGPASVRFGESARSGGVANQGSITEHQRIGPDVLTSADDSRVHSGIAGAGTRSGSVVYLNGTSVAAPQVAREVANLLASNQPADRDQLASIVGSNVPQVEQSGSEEYSGNTRGWKLAHPHAAKDRIDPEPAKILPS